MATLEFGKLSRPFDHYGDTDGHLHSKLTTDPLSESKSAKAILGMLRVRYGHLQGALI